MDVAEYRKRYEAELAKAAPPKGSRRAAGQAAEEATTPAARVEAIAAAPLDEKNRPKWVAELIAILRNRDEPLEVRMAALQALGALDFLGPRFAPFRAEYKQALRDVATDPERALRESALDLLAIARDPFAQELLVRGLKEPKKAVVSEALAIQFLGYDDHHAEVVPLAREVFARAKGVAREEALRVLAADPDSEKLFSRLLKDKSEKASIRRLSASGLQSLNPGAFEKAARGIVADESDHDDIRTTSLAALAHGREAREKPSDPKLVDAVQKLGETTRSPAMRSSIRRFLQSTDN